MTLRNRLLAACFVAFSCQFGRADVVVMDQIGPNGSDLQNFLGDVSLSQTFEPANAANSSATVDDFTLTSPTTLTSVQVAMLAFNGGTFASFAAVTNWEVAIYSSQTAAATTLIGNIADVNIAPANVTILGGFTTDTGSALITIPLAIALAAGTYQIAVIPRLDFTPFGEVGVYKSSGGSPGGSNAAIANPGGGFGFTGNLSGLGVDAAYKITAASVPEPSSALLVSIGLGLCLFSLRQTRRQSTPI
jgi:hypothetical protein